MLLSKTRTVPSLTAGTRHWQPEKIWLSFNAYDSSHKLTIGGDFGLLQLVSAGTAAT